MNDSQGELNFDGDFDFDPPEEEEHGAARWSDPATSHEAAEALDPASLYGKILKTLSNARSGSIYSKSSGLITHEISHLTGIQLVTISPRMSPMEKKGWVKRTGQTRIWIGAPGDKATKRESIIWDLT